MLSSATKTLPQFGEINLVGANPVKCMLRDLDISVVDQFLFDIPPWMAIDLSKMFSNIRTITTQYITTSDNYRIDSDMWKYSFIERSQIPSSIKRIFAHHVAIVAEKDLKK
jgi:hypothetical protein